MEVKRKLDQSLEKRAQTNRMMKEHYKYNKKIVMTLLNNRIQ